MKPITIITTLLLAFTFGACTKEKQNIIPTTTVIPNDNIYDSLNGSVINFKKDQTLIYTKISHNFIHLSFNFDNAEIGATVIIQSPIQNVMSFVITDTNSVFIATQQPNAIIPEHNMLNIELQYLGYNNTTAKHYYSLATLSY